MGTHLFVLHVAIQFVAPLILLGVTLWVRRQVSDRESRVLYALMTVTTLWAVSITVEFFTPGAGAKAVLFPLRYVFGAAFVIGWLVFALYYTDREEWLTPATWAVFGASFLVGAGLALVNPSGLVWTDFRVEPEPFRHLYAQRGPLFWALTAGGFAYLTAGLALLGKTVLESRRIGRAQALLLALSLLPSFLAHFLQNAAFVPVPGFDYRALTWSIFAAIIAYTLLSKRLLVVSPLTRTTILEAVDDGVIVVNADDLVVDYNGAAADVFPSLSGNEGDPLRVVAPRLVSDRDAPPPDRYADNVVRFDDDDRRQYVVESSPLGDDGHVLTIRDVTQIEEYARKLEQQTEQLDEFVGVVSHDLRNPLNVASGYVQTAMDTGETDFLEEAATSLDRAEEIIDESLTLAREGQAIEDREFVSLANLARQAWRNSETASATLDVAADDDRTVYADPGRAKNLFENLFRNSVEHSSTGSQPEAGDSVEHGSTSNRPEAGDSVEHGSTGSQSEAGDSVEHGSTSSRTESDDAVDHGPEDVTVQVGVFPGLDGFYVEDDGPGIPADRRDDVLDKGYTTRDDGTGFGLAIVDSIADAHGWKVEVAEGTDGGARFEFSGVDVVTPEEADLEGAEATGAHN